MFKNWSAVTHRMFVLSQFELIVCLSYILADSVQGLQRSRVQEYVKCLLHLLLCLNSRLSSFGICTTPRVQNKSLPNELVLHLVHENFHRNAATCFETCCG